MTLIKCTNEGNIEMTPDEEAQFQADTFEPNKFCFRNKIVKKQAQLAFTNIETVDINNDPVTIQYRDAIDKGNLDSVCIEAMMNLTLNNGNDVVFRCLDNIEHVFDSSAFIEIVNQKNAYVKSTRDKMNIKLQEIENITSQEELGAFDVDAGW